MLYLKLVRQNYFDQLKIRLAKLVADQAATLDFIECLIKGSFSNSPNVHDTGLRASLLNLQDTFMASTVLHSKAGWHNEGIAQLLELLKKGMHKNLDELCNDSVGFLVKYLRANQGAIFLLDDSDPDNPHLYLNGMYAYNKRKYHSQQISLGEGLIGECFADRSPIYMTDIPKNYVKITSGLGEATPTSIVLIPLTSNDKTIGVIELASFNTYEQNEIEFLNKVAESIAGILLRKTDMEKTNDLLAKSRKLSVELEEKERSLQQNLEELQSTQEELNRQCKELEFAKGELEKKNSELQFQKDHEAELLASHLSTQETIHQKVVERLKLKIKNLEVSLGEAKEFQAHSEKIKELLNK